MSLGEFDWDRRINAIKQTELAIRRAKIPHNTFGQTTFPGVLPFQQQKLSPTKEQVIQAYKKIIEF